jgi:tight adherence protein B
MTQIVALTFIAVLALFLGVYWFLAVGPEHTSRLRLRKRLKVGLKIEKRLNLARERERLSEVAVIDHLLARASRLSTPLVRTIDESGLKMTVGLLLTMSGCAALAVYLAVFFVTRLAVVALLAGACVSVLPYLYVRRARKKRIAKFEEQFPETIDLIVRALRAGHAFTTALGMVADEMPDPTKTEFRLLYDRQNFGMSLPDALREFAERVPLLDSRFFVTAVLVQREAGGNLAEVLENLGRVIRERFKVKRQIRVVTAHGRLTGWVLVAFPPILATLFLLVVPDSTKLLVNDPLGVRMVIGAAMLQIVGTLLIRKIVDVEY